MPVHCFYTCEATKRLTTVDGAWSEANVPIFDSRRYARRQLTARSSTIANGSGRRRTAANGSERQRTAANVSERQRTAANGSERQRTAANGSERQRTAANGGRQRTAANVSERPYRRCAIQLQKIRFSAANGSVFDGRHYALRFVRM